MNDRRPWRRGHSGYRKRFAEFRTIPFFRLAVLGSAIGCEIRIEGIGFRRDVL